MTTSDLRVLPLPRPLGRPRPEIVSRTVMVTQTLADLVGQPSDEAAFTKRRLASNLRRYRFHGEALKAEVERIMAGPRSLPDGFDALGSAYELVYPYGWRKFQMTRAMRRMFHGFARRLPTRLILDEWHMLADRPLPAHPAD